MRPTVSEGINLYIMDESDPGGDHPLTVDWILHKSICYGTFPPPHEYSRHNLIAVCDRLHLCTSCVVVVVVMNHGRLTGQPGITWWRCYNAKTFTSFVRPLPRWQFLWTISWPSYPVSHTPSIFHRRTSANRYFNANTRGFDLDIDL